MRVVLFDLDGTLVHSAPDIHDAANRMLADYGAAPLTLQEVTGFVGNGLPKLVQRCLRARGLLQDRAAIDTMRAHYDSAPARLTRPYPHVIAMLDALRAAGLEMGIVTNKPRNPAQSLLRKLRLDGYFATLIGGDTCRAMKPDPMPLTHALWQLGAGPDTALFVGDSETDHQTAQRAGVPLALFTGGYAKGDPRALTADLHFDDHRILTKWVLARALNA